MIVSIDSVTPPVATESGPRRETKNTSTTANTDSSTSSRTIGMASSRIARPIGPSVYSPWCDPAIASRIVVHRDGGCAAVSMLVIALELSTAGDAGDTRVSSVVERLLRHVRYRIDLDAQLLAGESRDTDRRAGGTMRAEQTRVDAVPLL